MGLPISTDMPRLIYDLMDLYPQSGEGRPSVTYVPLRRDGSHQTDAVNPPQTDRR